MTSCEEEETSSLLLWNKGAFGLVEKAMGIWQQKKRRRRRNGAMVCQKRKRRMNALVGEQS